MLFFNAVVLSDDTGASGQAAANTAPYLVPMKDHRYLKEGACDVVPGTEFIRRTAPFVSAAPEHRIGGNVELCSLTAKDNENDPMTVTIVPPWDGMLQPSFDDPQNAAASGRPISTLNRGYGLRFVVHRVTDYETAASHQVTFKICDDNDACNTYTKTINIVDAEDTPDVFWHKPTAAIDHVASGNSEYEVVFEWASPWDWLIDPLLTSPRGDTARPETTRYMLRYREDNSSDDWTKIDVSASSTYSCEAGIRLNTRNVGGITGHRYVVRRTPESPHGLQDGTSYEMQIIAINEAGNNGWYQADNYTTFTTPGRSSPQIKPTPIATLGLTPTVTPEPISTATPEPTPTATPEPTTSPCGEQSHDHGGKRHNHDMYPLDSDPGVLRCGIPPDVHPH